VTDGRYQVHCRTLTADVRVVVMAATSTLANKSPSIVDAVCLPSSSVLVAVAFVIQLAHVQGTISLAVSPVLLMHFLLLMLLSALS